MKKFELVDKIIKDYIPVFIKMQQAVKDRYGETEV